MTKNREPFFNFSEPVPVIFSGILIAIFVLQIFMPMFGLQLKAISALVSDNGQVGSELGTVPSWVPLITHSFLHTELLHVMINSFMVCVFGVLVCRAAGAGIKGALIFLFIFTFGGVIGGLAQWLIWIGLNTSGELYGAGPGFSALLAAAAWVVGGKANMLRWGAGWGMVNVILLIFDPGSTSSSIAWAAHLGGYLGGMLLAPVLLPPSSTAFKVTR